MLIKVSDLSHNQTDLPPLSSEESIYVEAARECLTTAEACRNKVSDEQGWIA